MRFTPDAITTPTESDPIEFQSLNLKFGGEDFALKAGSNV